MLANLPTEIRQAWRGLLRRPGFLLLATATLALGIAASVTVFALVERVLLRPLPYPQPGQLYAMGLVQQGGWTSITPQEYRATGALDGVASIGIASMDTVPVNLAETSQPEMVQAVTADRGFLETLAAPMALGRNFVAEEDMPNGRGAVIISHALWQRRFNGAPDVLGRGLRVEGVETPIVGVLPASFRYTVPVDLVLPLRLPPATDDAGRNYLAVLRLAETASVPALSVLVDARLKDLYESLGSGHYYRNAVFGLRALSTALSASTRPVLLLFLASALCVLLLAVVNLVTLMLLRALARSHAAAVRGALGASNVRLAMPMLSEGLLIGLLAALLGLGGAVIALRLAVSRLPPAWFTGGYDLDPGPLSVILAAGCALLAALLAAVLGVWRGRSSSRTPDLVTGGRGAQMPTSGRLGRALVVAQVALAALLLACAGLFSRSLLDAARVDLGFRSEDRIGFEIAPVRALYPGVGEVRELGSRIVERLQQLPGAGGATMASNLPIGLPLNYPVQVPGQDPVSVEFRAIDGGFLETFRIPLLAGRPFDARDREGGEPVVLVNQAFARALLALPVDAPPAQVLDRTLNLEMGEGPIALRVVGVVGDTRQHGPEHAAPPMVYIPFAQLPDGLMQLLRDFIPLRFAVHLPGDFASHARAITAAVAEVAPGQPLANLAPVDDLVRASTGGTRLALVLVGSFAGLAVLLSVVGLYAVVAVAAGSRMREFGVRSALGSTTTQLAGLVLGDGLRQAGLGVAIGLLLAIACTRWLGSVLEDMAGLDLGVGTAVALTLLTAALAACVVPAMRAARVAPARALRSE